MAKGLEVNGVRIAKARLSLPGSPTQAEFAKRIGIHWVTQSNIENGKAKVSLDLLERIAEETGTSRDFLRGSDEDESEAASMAPLAAEHHELLEALYDAIGVALNRDQRRKAVRAAERAQVRT